MSSVVLNLPVKIFSKSSYSKNSKNSNDAGIKVTPCVVDFGQLLKKTNHPHAEVVSGIPNVDLLHASANLIGVSLSELSDDVIYPTLCDKWSKTVLILLDEAHAEDKLKKSLTSLFHHKLDDDGKSRLKQGRLLTDIKPNSKESDSEEKVVNIFSDAESDVDNEVDDDDDDDNYMNGVDGFLQTIDERRKARIRWFENFMNKKTQSTTSSLPSSKSPPIGIENRLIACASFERSYERPGEKVVLLTLLAVRRKYRGLGIGSYIIKQILDPAVTGGSDVIVVNADNNAIAFFEKQGFTDDVILNSRYAHIGDVWFNSKRMCYLEGYTQGRDAGVPQEESYFQLREMELEIAQWKERSMQSYQSYASIVHRMRKEILTLHARVSIQEETISRLRQQLRVKSDSNAKQKPSLQSGRDAASGSSRSNVSSPTSKSDEVLGSGINKYSLISPQNVEDDYALLKEFVERDHLPTVDPSTNPPSSECTSPFALRKTSRIDEEATDILEMGDEEEADAVVATPAQLKKNLFIKSQMDDRSATSPSNLKSNACASLSVSDASAEGASDDILNFFLQEIKHCFLMSINKKGNDSDCNKIKVIDVVAASIPSKITSRFSESVKESHAPDMVANLYFCGGTRHQSNEAAFNQILKEGFSNEDFVQSDFGKGIHFSRYAKCAAHFSPSGSIIVATVCLGRNQTVTSKDSSRVKPPDGFDSILTSGRLTDSVAEHSEYIIFRFDRALPIALVSYQQSR